VLRAHTYSSFDTGGKFCVPGTYQRLVLVLWYSSGATPFFDDPWIPLGKRGLPVCHFWHSGISTALKGELQLAFQSRPTNNPKNIDKACDGPTRRWLNSSSFLRYSDSFQISYDTYITIHIASSALFLVPVLQILYIDWQALASATSTPDFRFRGYN
jgi:hypothetical protein